VIWVDSRFSSAGSGEGEMCHKVLRDRNGWTGWNVPEVVNVKGVIILEADPFSS
jgi:hypothetical protein